MPANLSDDHRRQLLDAGLSQREIARRTGIPRATLQDRLKRLGLRPVQRPVSRPDTGAVSSVGTGAVQAFDIGAVQRLDALEQEVQGLRLLMQSVVDRLDHPPVQTPVQITALPPYPKGKAVRWNLWIPDVMRDELATWAAERGISPSQLVQELLWQALSGRQASVP
jgi:hypothetical protein